MLLNTYQKEIFRPECNPEFQSLHCIARLDEDISEVLPYLNSVLGGFEYLKDPPAVVFKAHGRLITVQGRQIAMNALNNEAETDKILAWLQREINSAWENRDGIKPCFEGMPRPNLVQILKLLPKTNCRLCGEPTCMVFAARLTEGVYSVAACPEMKLGSRRQLENYLAAFSLD